MNMSKIKLTKSNESFLKALKKALKVNPAATLEEIGYVAGLTSGGVSWHMQALKKAKLVKRNKQGRLVVKK